MSNPFTSMAPQTPLVMMALGTLLFVLAAIGSTQGARFKGDVMPARFPMTSKYITFTFAGILVLGGLFMLFVRTTEKKTTWLNVFKEALGDWSTNFSNLSGLGLWIFLIIATIFAMIFITSIASPSDPLAWIGYAIIGILFIMIIVTSPLLKLKFNETAKLALGFLTTPKILGFLVIGVGVFSILALSAAYPLVSYLVYAFIIGLVLYFGRDIINSGINFTKHLFTKESDNDDSMNQDTNKDEEAKTRTWIQTLTRLGRNWVSDTLGWMTMNPKDYLEYEKAIKDEDLRLDAIRTVILKDYGFAAATVVTSGLIVALAIFLPRIYKTLPTLHIEPSLGYKYFTTPKPLSSFEKMPLSKIFTTNNPTSEYTISWWQFINSRKPDGNALPMIDLGSVGHVFLGPKPLQQTIAFRSPLSDTNSTRISYDIVFQKWQNIAIRASGNRIDVFVNGKFVATSNQPPPAIQKNMIFTLPGLPIQKTMGGIAGFATSLKAEPYLGILWNSLTDSPK